MRLISFISFLGVASTKVLTVTRAAENVSSVDGYLTPADFDYDLWRAVDTIKWDTLDYQQNDPVIDETKTPIFEVVTDPYDSKEAAPVHDNSSCSFSLDRLFNQAPPNYRRIIGSRRPYEDYSFPPENDGMIYWNDHASLRSDTSLKQERAYKFGPPIGQRSMWGDDGRPATLDIDQGDVQDCFMLASAAALSLKPERVKKMFLT